MYLIRCYSALVMSSIKTVYVLSLRTKHIIRANLGMDSANQTIILMGGQNSNGIIVLY